MIDKPEMTAPIPAVGAAGEQSSQNCTADIISGINEKSNRPGEDFEAMAREMQRRMLPSYLRTVTMPELYSTVFETQAPLMEGLLCRGTYLFVGSPKVGKPNALTLRLNILAGRLFTEHGIRYENKRSHDGRRVTLRRDDV